MGLAMATMLLEGASAVSAQDWRQEQRYRPTQQWNERYWRRYNKSQVAQLIVNIETATNDFRRDMDRWLDQSRFDGQTREQRFNSRVRNFEQATNQLRLEFDRRDSWWETRNNVQQMLTAARPVDQMMRRQRFDGSVEREWRRLRNAINRLATTYRLPNV
jgi:opacity protein-like surface antigen